MKVTRQALKNAISVAITILSELETYLCHVLGLGFDPSSKHLLPYVEHRSAIGDELLASNVVDSIHNANGIAVLAHPARYKLPFDILINEASILKFDAVELGITTKEHMIGDHQNLSAIRYLIVQIHILCYLHVVQIVMDYLF